MGQTLGIEGISTTHLHEGRDKGAEQPSNGNGYSEEQKVAEKKSDERFDQKATAQSRHHDGKGLKQMEVPLPQNMRGQEIEKHNIEVTPFQQDDH